MEQVFLLSLTICNTLTFDQWVCGFEDAMWKKYNRLFESCGMAFQSKSGSACIRHIHFLGSAFGQMMSILSLL
jgi:hypothetical protein